MSVTCGEAAGLKKPLKTLAQTQIVQIMRPILAKSVAHYWSNMALEALSKTAIFRYTCRKNTVLCSKDGALNITQWSTFVVRPEIENRNISLDVSQKYESLGPIIRPICGTCKALLINTCCEVFFENSNISLEVSQQIKPMV